MKINRTNNHIELVAEDNKVIRKIGTTHKGKRVVLPLEANISDYEEVALSSLN